MNSSLLMHPGKDWIFCININLCISRTSEYSRTSSYNM